MRLKSLAAGQVPGQRLRALPARVLRRRGRQAHLADASSELTAETRASYQQIAGELERRLGRFEEAARRFDALLQSPGVIGSELEALVRQEIALVAARDSGTHAIQTPDEAAE